MEVNGPKKLWFSYKPNIVSEVEYFIGSINDSGNTFKIDGIQVNFGNGNITNFSHDTPYMVLLFLNKGIELESGKIYEIEIQ